MGEASCTRHILQQPMRSPAYDIGLQERVMYSRGFSEQQAMSKQELAARC